MGITGNLDTMPLPELLQWLSQGEKTGTLVIDNGQVEKRIFFRRGKIISSASTEPREYLGHFLVAHGLISEEQLKEAVDRQERDKALIGKVLVSMGAVSEQTLDSMLRLKAQETIYGLFRWPRADFRFLENDLPGYEMVPISIDVTGLILEAMRRVDEWQRIQEIIPSPKVVPVGVVDDLATADGLSDGERKVLAAVNDDRTIEELALETHSSEFFVSEVVFRQVGARRLKVVRPRGQAAAMAAAPVEPDLGGKAHVDRAQEHFKAKRYDLALRHLHAARSLEPDDASIRGHVQQVEKVIFGLLARDGVVGTAVPHLEVGLEELTSLDVSPKAGFLLSRMNGTYDLAAIVKISPMNPTEAMLEVWRLVQAGHVRLQRK